MAVLYVGTQKGDWIRVILCVGETSRDWWQHNSGFIFRVAPRPETR